MSEATSNNMGGGTSVGTGGGTGISQNRHQKGQDEKALPKCPHCSKAAMHKPDHCFSLPKNEDKMKMANFVNEKFVKKVE